MLSSAMLTSRTPSVTGGSHLRSTMRSSSAGVRVSSNVRVRRSTASRYSSSASGRSGRTAATSARGMPVAGIRRVRCQSEALRPVVADPYLIGVHDLGNVVILHAGGMPHEPRDRVRSRRWRFRERSTGRRRRPRCGPRAGCVRRARRVGKRRPYRDSTTRAVLRASERELGRLQLEHLVEHRAAGGLVAG